MTFTATTALYLGLLGLGVGAFGTLLGSGGGFILTPVLLLLYPHDRPATITAISLTAVFFNAASGSAAYAHQRRIDYRSGLTFALAALPRSIAGALVVGVVSRHVFDGLMAVVLLALAVWLLVGEPGGRRSPRPTHEPGDHRSLRHDTQVRGTRTSRSALQHDRRLRLQLSRHRRRHHPCPAACAGARIPNAHRDRDLAFHPCDHRRNRRSDARSHRQLRARPRSAPRHCDQHRCGDRRPTRSTIFTANERTNCRVVTRGRSARARGEVADRHLLKTHRLP